MQLLRGKGFIESGLADATMRTRIVSCSLITCVFLYLAAFVVIHRSYSLRRPAANMLYWYYSDSPLLETVEFYGFWPLRHIAYPVPGFTSRHYLLEATPFRLPPETEAGG